MTNPAPQFRPPRSRQGPPKRPWLKYGLLTFAGALIVALAAVLIVRLTDDDDGGAEADGASETPDTVSTAGSADARAPVHTNPAFLFVVQLEDVEPGYEMSPTETYLISAEGFASGDYFATLSAGEVAAEEWGYLEGYIATLQPEGESAAVAQGSHYIRSEAYRFETVAGARAAYDYLESFHTEIAGSTKVEVAPLGNASSAYSIVSGTVAGTELPGAYHRLVGVRGNIVYIVQVYGVDQYTSIELARDYAVIVDEKVAGDREAPAPTPTPANSGAGAAPTVPPPTTTP